MPLCLNFTGEGIDRDGVKLQTRALLRPKRGNQKFVAHENDFGWRYLPRGNCTRAGEIQLPCHRKGTTQRRRELYGDVREASYEAYGWFTLTVSRMSTGMPSSTTRSFCLSLISQGEDSLQHSVASRQVNRRHCLQARVTFGPRSI